MLALRLPAEIETRLEALAKRTGRTKSFYAREAILTHLAQLETQADKEKQSARSGHEGVSEEARRQSLLLKDDPHERETLDWLQTASDKDGWS